MRCLVVIDDTRPVPWTRTRGSGKRRFNDPKYAAWKESFAWMARQVWKKPPTVEPVATHTAVFPTGTMCWITDPLDDCPLAEWGSPGRVKHLRGDLDNYVKAVHDALQGIVFTDDRLVVHVCARFCDDKPSDAVVGVPV